MEVFEGHRALFRPLSSPAVALGNFDGVHLGHHALLAAARNAAAQTGGDTVVYTFEPHPARVLAPERAPPLITTRQRKLELLADAGVSACILEPFDAEFAAHSPEEFFDLVLARVLGARQLVVGYDFTFGRHRAGDASTLRTLAAPRGIGVQVIAPVRVGGVVVSSTEVRRALTAGDVRGASALLGRPFDCDGQVVHGEGRGRKLGIPTANVASEGEMLPASGIYAVRLSVLEGGMVRPFPGAASLGTNPTFPGGKPTLEVHVIDFEGDLYGRRVRVEFIERLREERRYESIAALVEQIWLDIDAARLILEKGR
jgi:riboflavin kinase/FMN adenylyltransferase